MENLEVYDEDGVSEHNIPNQFYRWHDEGDYKVDALKEVVQDFSNITIKANKGFYEKQKLQEMVIVATDSMASRKVVWNQFLKQNQCHYYIEARMGAELGFVYSIRKRYYDIPKNDPGWRIDIKDARFYEKTLYPDSKVKQLKCTAKSIIYNILMITSLISRSVKGIVSEEYMPREQIFDMEHITHSSYMIRE